MTPFVFNDETRKNSHGFYLLNAGGRFERFNANPVMLDNHDLNRLIGKWENMRIEGVLLVADPVFDDGTALGAERKGQVERGFLKGASPGIIILEAEWRHNAATGNEDLYVTKWELFESSTTPVPSNAGAVTLRIYDTNHQLVPEENVQMHIDDIMKLSLQRKNVSTIDKLYNDMDKITLTAEARIALGIDETANETAINAAIVKIKTELKVKTEEIDRLKNAENNRLKKDAENVAKLAVNQGKWPGNKMDKLIQMAIDDMDGTVSLLESIPQKQTLSGKITPISDVPIIPAGREKWTLHMWLKNDEKGLAKIKAEEPDMYESIRKIGNN